jgi:RNA polymerase sigma-70 factor (ECF subfamily)
LVEGAAGGDREAIAAIWDRYSGLVRGVLHGALGPDQAIEDLVQEVFLAFLRGVKKMDDGAALRGYLASVAVRQAALEIRKRQVRRWVGLSPTGELPERAADAEDVEGRAALRALHRVLDKLPSRRRMAFVLRHVQGLELLEAGAALGVSESTLRRELVTARQQVLLWASREPALAEFLSRMKEAHRE